MQRRNVRRALVLSVAFTGWAAQAVTWDNDLDNSQWSAGANWSGSLEPSATDDVVLSSPIPANGGTILMTAGEVANSLRFESSYTFIGGDLTLTSGIVDVGGSFPTIQSVLRGNNGLTKTGTGTLLLGTSTAYTGSTAISAGALESAATSGSVGTGNLLINGKLTLRPVTIDASTNISLSSANATPSNATVFGPGATIDLQRNGNRSLTYTIGNADAAPNSALVRGAAGTLIIRNGSGIANLGSSTGERLFVQGGVPTTNGMVSPTIQSSEGDFLTYSQTNGLTRATYSSSTNLNGGVAGDTRIFEVKTPQTLSANTEVYALRVAENITTNGFSVKVGSGGVTVAGPQRTLPTLDFGSNNGLVNVAGFTFVSTLQGSGGVTVFGDGTSVWFPSALSGLTGGVRIASGIVHFSTPAFGSNTVRLGSASLYFDTGASASFSNDLVLDGGGVIGALAYGPFTFTGQINGGPTPGAGLRALTLTGDPGANNGFVRDYSFGTSPKTFTGDLAIVSAMLSVPAQGSADPTILGGGAKSIILSGGAIFHAIANGATVLHDPLPATKSIQVVGSGSILADSGVTMMLDDPGQLTGDGVLKKTGTGTLILGSPSSGQTSFAGSVDVSQGILRVRNREALGSGAPGRVSLSGGTLQLRNDGTGSNSPINFGFDVSVTGNSTINVDRELSSVGNTIHLGSLAIGATKLTTTSSNGYGLAFDGTTTLTGAATFAPSATSLILAGPIVDGSQGGQLTLDPGFANGTMTLGGIASHTGGTVINSGTLLLTSTGNITAGPIQVARGATFEASQVPGGFSLGAGRRITTFGRVAGTLNIGGSLECFGTVDGAVKVSLC